MKTEPTESRKKLSSKCENMFGRPVVGFYSAEEAINEAFKEGQSSPKIKQLEWVETDEDGVKGIEAKTPFGDYEVYEKNDHDGYILWWFDPNPYVFDTETQAKMYAQADFEKMVMECLDM